MRMIREYPRHTGGGSCVMHDDTISFVVEQFGSYSIVAEARHGGQLVERSTVQLSREEMQRIIADVQKLQAQEHCELERPGVLDRSFSRMLALFR